jgi:DNA-binding MarR family transcriptional regulator
MKEQTGLWIDNNILYSDLTPTEKLILADIVSLSNGSNKFIKTNNTISTFTNVSLRTVNYAVKSLIDKGLVTSIISFPYGSIKKKRTLVPCYELIKKLGDSE